MMMVMMMMMMSSRTSAWCSLDQNQSSHFRLFVRWQAPLQYDKSLSVQGKYREGEDHHRPVIQELLQVRPRAETTLETKEHLQN